MIDKADETMGSAKEAADKVEAAVTGAQKTFRSAGRIMDEALAGAGKCFTGKEPAALAIKQSMSRKSGNRFCENDM